MRTTGMFEDDGNEFPALALLGPAPSVELANKVTLMCLGVTSIISLMTQISESSESVVLLSTGEMRSTNSLDNPAKKFCDFVD